MTEPAHEPLPPLPSIDPERRPVGGSLLAPKEASAIPKLDVMPTGVEGLDHLLNGGIVRGNSLLVEGPPGSGKTTLAVRILYEGIVKYGEPGLIITFEEFPRQLYVQAQAFGVDLHELEEAGMLRVIWTPPSRILEGFNGRSNLLEGVIQELGVKRVLIDSITHFKRVAASESELREILSDVLSNLKIQGINALFTKELERIDDESIAFEEYLVDASLRLTNEPGAQGSSHVRRIEVRKTRGQPHISGHHPFDLTNAGPSVYPRLRTADIDRLFEGIEPCERRRVSTGVDEIDGMLHGGLWQGSLNIVDGGPGTGKSVIANHFLDAGMREGEQSLLISMRQSASNIISQVRTLGLEWESAVKGGQLEIVHYHPTDLCVGKMVDELVRIVRDRLPARLVFDSIDDLHAAVKDEDAVRDYLLFFARLFEAGATTAIMIRHRGNSRDVIEYTPLSSCTLRLEMEQSDHQMSRLISVLKHAGSDHSKSVLPYTIQSDGFRLIPDEPEPAPEPVAPVSRLILP